MHTRLNKGRLKFTLKFTLSPDISSEDAASVSTHVPMNSYLTHTHTQQQYINTLYTHTHAAGPHRFEGVPQKRGDPNLFTGGQQVCICAVSPCVCASAFQRGHRGPANPCEQPSNGPMVTPHTEQSQDHKHTFTHTPVVESNTNWLHTDVSERKCPA